MSTTKCMLGMIAVFALSAAAVASPDAEPPTRGYLSSHTTYRSGSAEYQRALQFLQQRFAEGKNPVDVRELTTIGPVEVTRSKSFMVKAGEKPAFGNALTSGGRGSLLVPQPGDPIPEPPDGSGPPSGAPGSSPEEGVNWRYALCTATTAYTWEYQNQCPDKECAWVLTEYSRADARPCGSS